LFKVDSKSDIVFTGDGSLIVRLPPKSQNHLPQKNF
jgi:hypothetical protein